MTALTLDAMLSELKEVLNPDEQIKMEKSGFEYACIDYDYHKLDKRGPQFIQTIKFYMDLMVFDTYDKVKEMTRQGLIKGEGYELVFPSRAEMVQAIEKKYSRKKG